MNKLRDKIRRATRVDSPPLGFAAVARPRDASMLVVARVEASALASAAALAPAADAVLVDGPLAPKELVAAAETARALGDAPLGLTLRGGSREDAKALHEAGLDFVVLDTEAPAALLRESGVAVVLAISPEMADALLRALEGLPAEALLVNVERPRLRVADQLTLARLAGLARKPLFVQLRDDAPLEDLESLRDAGAAAVVLGVKGAEGTRRLEAAKDAVARLPPRRRRREERPEVVLPSPRQMMPQEEQDEEEEE